MKKIYILLSRTQSILSRTVHLVTQDPFTHAAIAFDEDMQLLYSSARWDGETMFPSGPCQESLTRGFYARKKTPCAVYELLVEDEVYQKAKEAVAEIIARQNQYRFNIIGLFLCWCHIPYRRKSHYFCSQFVAEILQRSGAVELPKEPCLMRPSDYTRMPVLQPSFLGYISQLQMRGIAG